MSDDLVSIVRRRLDDGRQVSDVAVHGLLEEIDRLRALVTPTPPAQDATHGAQAQRTGSDEGEAPEGAGWALWCRSCGTVFTPPLECDCERMGTPELRDAIPYTYDEPGGAL